MSKIEILSRGFAKQKVDVPEWPDEEVFVRKLSGRQVEKAMSLIEAQEKSAAAEGGAETNGKVSMARMAGELFVLFTCDASGVPLFAGNEVDNILDQCDFAPVQRCVEAGLEFNFMTDSSYRKLRGNSKGARRGGPG